MVKEFRPAAVAGLRGLPGEVDVPELRRHVSGAIEMGVSQSGFSGRGGVEGKSASPQRAVASDGEVVNKSQRLGL